MIDSDLKWDSHITMVRSKVARAISQFTVTICACADKGNCRTACEIAIDLKTERAFVKLFH